MVGFIVFIILMAALSNFFAAVEDMGQLISFVLAFTATYRFTKRLIAQRKEEKERDYREELKDELRDEIREEMRQGSIQRALIMSTGALLSTISSGQGESIPGIAHAVVLEAEGGM